MTKLLRKLEIILFRYAHGVQNYRMSLGPKPSVYPYDIPREAWGERERIEDARIAESQRQTRLAGY